MSERRCPVCGTVVSARQTSCHTCESVLPPCEEPEPAEQAPVEEAPPAAPPSPAPAGPAVPPAAKPTGISAYKKPLIIAGIVLLMLLFGRVYYGEGVFRVTFKLAPGFTDTFVNLSEIMNTPRLAVAIKHPEVKRQLEQMGAIETDEQTQERVQREFEEERERKTASLENGRLTVEGFKWRYEPYANYAVGALTNRSGMKLDSVSVTITCKDKDKNVLGTTHDITSNLADGETWHFKAPVFEEGTVYIFLSEAEGTSY
jgi:hypothetical protein